MSRNPNALPETAFNPFRLDDVLPPLWRRWPLRGLQRGMESLLGLGRLARGYARLPESRDARTFVHNAFRELDVRYRVVQGQLADVPATGPLLVVANHPYGAVEGMLMIALLMQRRSDVRILANSVLKRVPELTGVFLGVNPYGNAARQNVGPLRQGLRWLQDGGVLVVFPAGDVSSIRLRDRRIQDGAWDRSVARLARRSGASVLPVYIPGRNSTAFYLASLLHPVLKTLLLPRQLVNKRGRTIEVRLGRPITARRLAAVGDDERQMAFLRLRTYLLAGGETPADRQGGRDGKPLADIVPPVSADTLVREMAGLPAAQRLAEAGDLEVWYARAQAIPAILAEIGRLREISFRAVGEGTGRETDLDLYDAFYLHLFVWNRAKREVVGGYRLGLADEIVSRFGRSGLYSYSLFRYRQAFLQHIQPAIELGRSFVRPEYQRSFTPLMLLWKGIGQFVARHPRYAVLFGPVSISADYSATSRRLLVEFLRRNVFDPRLSRTVRPRAPYRTGRAPVDARACDDPEALAALLAEIEPDDKGMPVLIRQYLKLGGRMLGFNLDADFGNVVDGLIRVDLRNTDPRILRKYMGAAAAEAFLAYHAEACRATG